MHLSTYLIFDGNCHSAFQFYERCLGGHIEAMATYGEMPEDCGDQVPAAQRDRIMHARLAIDGQWLMGSDTTSVCPVPYQGIQGAHVTLNVDSPEEAERIFHALSDNGTIQMPLEETFWAQRFGMCIDPYGVPWMINCEKAM